MTPPRPYCYLSYYSAAFAYVQRLLDAGFLWENEHGAFGEDGHDLTHLRCAFDGDVLWFQACPDPAHDVAWTDRDAVEWDGYVRRDDTVWEPCGSYDLCACVDHLCVHIRRET